MADKSKTGKVSAGKATAGKAAPGKTTNQTTKQLITDTLERNFMPYAMSVIVSRAIPEIDGFKPSHRKLLYTMYKMGLLGSGRTKSANIVGQTMKLNPHGDQAIYETMVRLTQGNGALLHPYIDSKGNFGRVYSRDMQYAAARYTEAKLAKICEEVFGGLDRDSVEFVDNYDGTVKEPVLLPTAFPAVLVNSNQGIAVGMASNICSFNLAEVCQATIAYIRDPTDELLDLMPAPDFSTGGDLIYNLEDIIQIYQTGRGSIKLRARYQIDRKESRIEVFEIPYTTTAEAIIDEIANAVRTGKIRDIADVRDETDLQGLKITIDCRRSADPEQLMQRLFRMTSMESTFGCNFNVLINGTPRVLGVKGLIAEWLTWRRMCLRREIEFDLARKRDRLHLLRGLEKILLDIDKAIRIIRQTEKEADVIPNLMQGFSIDESQAEYVAEIRLRQLNRQVILQRLADIRSLVGEIADLQDILENRGRLDQRIISQLEEIARKYGKPRLTRIVQDSAIETLSDTQMIEDYRIKLFLTAHGYLKKLPLTSLRSAGDLKTKEDDEIIQEVESTNKCDLVLFSDKGTVYKLRNFDVRDHKPSEFGEYTPNLLELEDGEKIVFIHATADYTGQMLIGFANGKFARFPFSAYETKTNRRKLINAYSTVSPPVAFFHLSGDEDFAAESTGRKILVFNSAQVALKATRGTQGVQVLLSRKGSQMSRCQRLEDTDIIKAQYYRMRSLPAVGNSPKAGTMADRQTRIEDSTETGSLD